MHLTFLRSMPVRRVETAGTELMPYGAFPLARRTMTSVASTGHGVCLGSPVDGCIPSGTRTSAAIRHPQSAGSDRISSTARVIVDRSAPGQAARSWVAL